MGPGPENKILATAPRAHLDFSVRSFLEQGRSNDVLAMGQPRGDAEAALVLEYALEHKDWRLAEATVERFSLSSPPMRALIDCAVGNGKWISVRRLAHLIDRVCEENLALVASRPAPPASPDDSGWPAAACTRPDLVNVLAGAEGEGTETRIRRLLGHSFVLAEPLYRLNTCHRELIRENPLLSALPTWEGIMAQLRKSPEGEALLQMQAVENLINEQPQQAFGARQACLAGLVQPMTKLDCDAKLWLAAKASLDEEELSVLILEVGEELPRLLATSELSNPAAYPLLTAITTPLMLAAGQALMPEIRAEQPPGAPHLEVCRKVTNPRAECLEGILRQFAALVRAYRRRHGPPPLSECLYGPQGERLLLQFDEQRQREGAAEEAAWQAVEMAWQTEVAAFARRKSERAERLKAAWQTEFEAARIAEARARQEDAAEARRFAEERRRLQSENELREKEAEQAPLRQAFLECILSSRLRGAQALYDAHGEKVFGLVRSETGLLNFGPWEAFSAALLGMHKEVAVWLYEQYLMPERNARAKAEMARYEEQKGAAAARKKGHSRRRRAPKSRGSFPPFALSAACKAHSGVFDVPTAVKAEFARSLRQRNPDGIRWLRMELGRKYVKELLDLTPS